MATVEEMIRIALFYQFTTWLEELLSALCL